MALLLTLITGLFFLIGMFIYQFSKHKDNIMIMSISCAFIVILGLIFFDLIPELIAMHKPWLFIFALIGLTFLFFFDKLIPHHHHEHKLLFDNKKEHKEHLEHVSLITLLALLLHNLIEGISLYSIAQYDLSSGLLMTLCIGLHNLPFGFSLNTIKNKYRYLLIILLVISGFLGGIIGLLFNNINNIIKGIILSLTLGMIIYIAIWELGKEVLNNKGKKVNIYGIIIGIVLLIIINLI